MKHLLFATLLILLAASCTERIDVSTDTDPPHLVIYGYINTDTVRHHIRITRSAGYFTTHSPEGISHADVTISTDDQIIHLHENDTIPGLYQTAPNVYGRTGKTYTLNAKLDFDGDGVQEHYQASSYLTEINDIDSIALQPSPVFRRAVELLLYAQDTQDENYYSIFVSVNDSILNSRISGFYVMDDVFFNGTYMNGVACYYLNPKTEDGELKLIKGDKVTMNINAITKEYADFISQAKSEIGGTNPIFGGPPANVETNIRRIEPPGAVDIYGFFTAFPSRYANVIVTEDYSSLGD
ncbi:MAG: DUF4249 domain-containing protein [Bacteroidales bacterium]|jgi:hypothetical protein|nr:DUF4249 domain-containing protein [Bacteroidales bacterium]